MEIYSNQSIRKNNTFWAVFGSILILFGITFTIPLTIKGGIYFYGLLITCAAIISGVLLIAWVFRV